jgi:hypothetical protein
VCTVGRRRPVRASRPAIRPNAAAESDVLQERYTPAPAMAITGMERAVSQSRRTMRMRRTPTTRATRAISRSLAIVAALIVVIVAVASCGGGDRQQTIPDAELLPSGPPPTIEAHVQARPWASSKAAGQAFGRIWRKEIRNPKDRNGRGIAAYNWAGRTCDAVRNGGQAPEAMVQRVHDEGRFTRQGARVIVSAALRALCPAQGASTQLFP